MEALASLMATLPGWRLMGKDDEQCLENTEMAVERIDRGSTFAVDWAPAGVKLLERDCFADFKTTVELARTDAHNPTLLVYGARGVGKTSMVAGALEGVPGVRTMPYRGDGTDFEQRLEWMALKCTGLPTDGHKADLGDRLRAILTFYQKTHGRRPIFVIEMTSKTEPAALAEVLLAAKQLGFEERLATFVIVVSASKSALGLPIGIRQLRVRGYNAPDFSGAEAQAYLTKKLPSFPELPTFVVEQVGTRAMDLVEVCSRCRGAESELQCRERVKEYREECIKDAWFALSGFVAIAEQNAAFDKDACLVFFTNLLEGTCVQTDAHAADAFGFEGPNLLLAALAEDHAFEVDPFSHKITMQSHFMHIAIEQYLQGARAIGAAGTGERSWA